MPAGRAVLLLRRLSTGDNRFKNLNFGQNTKEQFISNCFCHNKDLVVSKRLCTFSQSKVKILARSYSDNTIKMSVSNTDNMQHTEHKHTNRLINEKSPYLLQHAHNPVDWYPWCQEAIDRAKQENKLIFLSVGYSTCHWCHVMEKESFENEEVAKIMNENFINIKVDREERPDIDRVYMLFITASSGSGGWPMSVFITPDLKPITGGTYFPPEDNWGRPGFKSLLKNLATKWKENQVEWSLACNKTMDALKRISAVVPDTVTNMPGELIWNNTVQGFITYFEPDFGGFGLAPKFPQASILNFLFHYYARDKTLPEGKKCLDMCLVTLKKIANGGIHDHISGGFARYSVDNDWHVPHFEKMLYDQAQLVVAYTDAFLATKDDFYAGIVKDIIKYVKRDLRHESGGFYSAEDADSYPTFGAKDKTEGAFYVWGYQELKSLLEEKTINSISYLDIFCDYFSVEEDGNTSAENDPHGELKGKNVLIVYGSKEETCEKFNLTTDELDRVLSACSNVLHAARQKRPRPHLDTKMLCSWNGLMLSGLAQAGQGLSDKTFVEDAIKTAQFIKTHLFVPETQTLLRSCYKADDGSIVQQEHKINGFLDDYAFLIKGLLDLYEASLDEEWLNWARELQSKQNELFWEPVHGGYYTSPEDPTVVLRIKEDRDGAEPSGNSVSCHNLQRIAAYADKSSAPAGGEAEREMAKKLLAAFSKKLKEAPTALPEMISALMFYHDSPTQVVISGGRSDPRTLELVRAVRSRLLPGRVLAVTEPDSAQVYNRLRSSSDVPSAYVCRRYACSLPITDVKQLESLLDEPPNYNTSTSN